ncbi:MAG: NusG domain II-containing protein [Hespellia sp.]|nr:NusG domain II-containing protein [Hespellia sp.]
MKLKKHDIILILAVLVIAAAALMVNFYIHKTGDIVKVTLDGEVYGTYELGRDQTIQIDSKNGSNTLTIKDGRADMTDADCPDQICVKESPLEDDTPRTIVCLPHKLIVEIKQK